MFLVGADRNLDSVPGTVFWATYRPVGELVRDVHPVVPCDDLFTQRRSQEIPAAAPSKNNPVPFFDALY